MKKIDEISLSTCIFAIKNKPDIPLAQQAEITLASGINYIELSERNSTPDDIKSLAQTDIKVWAVHGILGFGCISPDKNERIKAVEIAYTHASQRAMFAPCPLVEHYFNRYNDPNIGLFFRDSIEMLYDKVSQLGYTLCIETAPYKPFDFERHPDSKEIADFVKSFGKDDLQVIVDFNHSNITEDLADTAKNTANLVKSVHISQNNGQKEEHLPPWEGIIDLKHGWDAFRKHGYTGPCNMEFHFPGAVDYPSVEDLVKTREYMENLLWK